MVFFAVKFHQSEVEVRAYIWFKGLCAVLAAGLLLLAHRWRMRHLADRYWERFQARLAERERIARSLHDNLMQNFQALIMFFHIVSDKLPEGDATRSSIDAILNQTGVVMAQARQEITELRGQASGHATSLGQALAKFGGELEVQFGPRFHLAASRETRHFTALAYDQVLCIGREAIFNAYRHAQPKNVMVELDTAQRGLRLLVSDDGCGLDAKVQREGGRMGHWGLPGMRERALALGTIAFRNRHGGGTEIELKVPAKRAYTQDGRPAFWRRVLARFTLATRRDPMPDAGHEARQGTRADSGRDLAGDR